MSENSKPKSKYLRDGKPELKHARKKTNANTADSRNKQNNSDDEKYRQSVMTPKRAREEMLAREAEEPAEINDTAPAEEEVTAETTIPEADAAPAEETRDEAKEEAAAEAKKKTAARRLSKEELMNRKRRANARMAICIAVLAFAAELLQLASFRVPFTPSFLTVDFSVLPELIASIAYGPLVGVLICVLKNVINMALIHSRVVSDLTNILLDSIFVFIAGLLYSHTMFSGKDKLKKTKKPKKGHRRRRIFSASFIGLLISLVPQFLITRYIAYPAIDWFYNERGASTAAILASYHASYYGGIRSYLPDGVVKLLPDLSTLTQYILVYNLPITFIRTLIIAGITALIYKYISPFLHYRPTDKELEAKRKR